MGSLAFSPNISGALLKPHFLPRKQPATGGYYANVLESVVLRQVAVAVAGGSFFFRLDRASLRASKAAKVLLGKENARAAPWLPDGAGVTPIDVFVNSALKEASRSKDTSSIGKLKKQTVLAIAAPVTGSKSGPDGRQRAAAARCAGTKRTLGAIAG